MTSTVALAEFLKIDSRWGGMGTTKFYLLRKLKRDLWSVKSIEYLHSGFCEVRSHIHKSSKMLIMELP